MSPISSTAFSIMIWTVFAIGWLGASIIAIAVLWDFGKFLKGWLGGREERRRR